MTLNWKFWQKKPKVPIAPFDTPYITAKFGKMRKHKPVWLGWIDAEGIEIKIANQTSDCVVKVRGRRVEALLESITIELNASDYMPKFRLNFIGMEKKPK